MVVAIELTPSGVVNIPTKLIGTLQVNKKWFMGTYVKHKDRQVLSCGPHKVLQP